MPEVTPPASTAATTPAPDPSGAAESAGPAVTESVPVDTGVVHQAVTVVIPDANPARSAPAPDGAAADGSAAPPGGPAMYVPEASVDDVDKRLNVTLDGQTTYIKNGGRVELGHGLAVEIYLDPYPPTQLHSVMDVYVTQDGEPAGDVSVDVEFDMLSMLHGPFATTARDIGGGHHLATLDYIMFGAWDQLVTIRRDLERIRFPVVIVAYP